MSLCLRFSVSLCFCVPVSLCLSVSLSLRLCVSTTQPSTTVAHIIIIITIIIIIIIVIYIILSIIIIMIIINFVITIIITTGRPKPPAQARYVQTPALVNLRQDTFDAVTLLMLCESCSEVGDAMLLVIDAIGRRHNECVYYC